MHPRLLVLALATSALLAGCVAPPAADVDASATLTGLLAPDAALWSDPQNAPHPLFGYPTLTHVPDDPALPAFWRPIEARALPTPIEGVEHVAGTKDEVVQGAGIALFGRLAIVPGYGEPSKVLDISDPTDPAVLSELVSEKADHRGAAVIAYPTGRLVTVLSTEYGFDVWDISDPREPVNLGQVEPPSGGHKVAVVPGTPIVYNANSQGGAPRLRDTPQANLGMGEQKTEIYDLSDPENPVLVQEFENGYGCHHIFFWIDASQDKHRALCAGIEYTQIWDIADPRDPEVIVRIPVHHGTPGTPSYSTYINFSHFAILNQDGTVLVVGDESAGGAYPPGCDVRVDTPHKQVSGPIGNLWFYDVSDEKEPRLMGWFSPTTILPDTTSCTAHHGRLVPDPEGRDLLVMAFYGAGVVLVDFTDPEDAREVAQWREGTDTWEAWYYNGYVFTGDLKRGLDVLTFS